MVNITQIIREKDAATFEVTLNVDGKEVVEVFEKSNAVFPVYKTITEVLHDYDGVSVKVKTNSPILVKEFNEIENRNSTLLQRLRNIAARNAVVLTINPL